MPRSFRHWVDPDGWAPLLAAQDELRRTPHYAGPAGRAHGDDQTHIAVNYGDTAKLEGHVEAEVRLILGDVLGVDSAGDQLCDARADELPPESCHRETRQAGIRTARAFLEGETRERTCDRDAAPEARVPHNFSDSSSRRRPSKPDGLVPAQVGTGTAGA